MLEVDLNTLAAGAVGIALAIALYWLRRWVLGTVIIAGCTMLALSLVRYVLTG